MNQITEGQITFADLGLSEQLIEHLQSIGFTHPTPIQAQAIPYLLNEATDLIGLAQTGTGKTAAFGLPLLEILDPYEKVTQALVVAPTRELCQQIQTELERFSKGVHHYNITAIFGGASIVEQIKKLKRGTQIIVATPGRLIDMINRKAVDLSEVEYVVLDEADEMLNMGFKEDIDEILSHTPETKKVCLFSATMSDDIRRISKKYMHSPKEISIGERNQTNQNISHQYMVVNDRDRYQALKRILDFHPDMFGVIFCRTKNDTQMVAEQLMRDGYIADALHGDLTQAQRDKVMKAFKEKTLQILVATDVAARGIDVNNITHVMHMNLPDEMEYYTHRSGRTARAGKTGYSIALVTAKEVYKIKSIERASKVSFEKINVPTGKEICEQRLLSLIHRVHEVQVDETEMAHFMPKVMEELSDLSKEEIIKRFTSLEFNHFLDHYRDAVDLNQKNRAEKGTNDRGHRDEIDTDGDRLFINLGKMDGFDKGKMLGFICDRARLNSKDIGRIEIKGAYSFFTVHSGISKQTIDRIHGFEYKGRLVRIEVTQEEKKTGSYSDKRKSNRGGGEFRGKSGGGNRDFKRGKSFEGGGKSSSGGGAKKYSKRK